MNDINKRRRQAAWVCFQPHLAEDQLFKAIHLLERGYQADSVSNLIAYISKVCSEFGIGPEIRKSLYGRFHQLMTEDTGLQVDPLSAMLEQSQSQPLPKSVQRRPASALSSVERIEERQEAAASLPAHTVVFSDFMKQLMAYFPEKNALFEVLMELAGDKKTGTRENAGHISRWANKPDDFGWAEDLDENALAGLVHLVYTALCEMLGPVAADECFHKVIAVCEQKPEARQFSPSRFL
ncbi:MAG: hypothetical protein M8364_12220 [Methylobacter sp.]|uniref:hypothetical protein n=1 Tax=Methylobacter sp. TaxID=2051955 RepID=UPI00258B83D8|nr:hypothetical protein [Methylobacter sp.]MCL7421658.1 hypothetical protein [Methylobacter sp.]